MTDLQHESGLQRRTIIKGAAWALPVVAIAAATPAVAASGPPQPANTVDSLFDVSFSIARVASSTPQRVDISLPSSNVTFYSFDSNGDEYPAGTYTSGALFYEVHWGASAARPVPGSYTLTETNLNGWTRVGSPTTSGTEVTVVYTHPEILNGVENSILQPRLRLLPTTGNSLPQSTIRVSISGDYLSEVFQGVNTP